MDKIKCHCESDALDIPPGHVEGCPFADPEYCPEPPDPKLVRGVLLEAFHRAVARRERGKNGRERS